MSSSSTDVTCMTCKKIVHINTVLTILTDHKTKYLCRKHTVVEENDKKGVIISAYAHKGGSGKTLFTSMIASEYGNRGQRVCIIDGDCQMNITRKYIGDENFKSHLTELRGRRGERKTEISCIFDVTRCDTAEFSEIKTNYDNIFLIKGSFYDSTTETQLAVESHGTSRAVHNKFKDFLLHLRKKFDMVLIDLNPGMSMLNKCFLKYSDYILCPLTPDAHSCIGFGLLIEELIEDENDLVNGVKLMGVVLNRVRQQNMKLTSDSEQLVNGIKSELDTINVSRNKKDKIKCPILSYLEELASISIKMQFSEIDINEALKNGEAEKEYRVRKQMKLLFENIDRVLKKQRTIGYHQYFKDCEDEYESIRKDKSKSNKKRKLRDAFTEIEDNGTKTKGKVQKVEQILSPTMEDDINNSMNDHFNF